jgi:hypothetical protein
MKTTKESPRETDRKTASLVGVLFIIGTVMGVLSVVFVSPVLGGPGYLARIAANPAPMILGAFCMLVMGLALAMVPLALFPILRRYHEPLAIGYVVFRSGLEMVTALGVVGSWLLLVTLGQEYAVASAAAGSPAGPEFQTLGVLISKAAEISSNAMAVLFPIGAIMLYVVCYQSKLIPRWLSVWGLIAVVLHLALTGLAGLANLNEPSLIQVVANAPILVQEMVMAAWLIVKGFSPSAVAPGALKTAANELLSVA